MHAEAFEIAKHIAQRISYSAPCYARRGTWDRRSSLPHGVCHTYDLAQVENYLGGVVIPDHIVLTSHTANLQRPLLPSNTLAQQPQAHEQGNEPRVMGHIAPTILHPKVQNAKS